MLLERPKNSDDLISEADFVKDERLPYWADLWPSAHALAGEVVRLAPAKGRALELGCGLGLVTIAALRAGFSVLATDYYPDALLFTRRNAIRAGLAEPEVRMVDWRAFPADLGLFDLVLASDVLYEREYAELVAEVTLASLAPGGVGLIGDPGRVAFPEFVTACERRGGSVRERSWVPYEEGAIRQTIRIHEIRGRRP